MEGNHKYKNIGIRIAALVLIGIISVWIYNQFIWPLDRKEHAYFLEQLHGSQDTCDLIYIGESSNFWSHKDSGDIREISKMLEHKTGRKVLNLSKSAYHLGIYRPVFDHLKDLENLKDAILTVNLRTFGPPCVHSNLETSLQKDRLFLVDEMPFIKKMRAVFSLYDNTNAKVRDAQMWQQWTYDTLTLEGKNMPHHTVKHWCSITKFPDSSGQEYMPSRVLADHYVKAYGFNLDATNPRIRDLDAIIQQVSNTKYNLHLLILSENTQWADSLAGSDMANLIRENRNFIVNRYANKHPNIHIIDCLELVPAQYFGEKDWTTEHYFWQGRGLIAEKIKAHLEAELN